MVTDEQIFVQAIHLNSNIQACVTTTTLGQNYHPSHVSRLDNLNKPVQLMWKSAVATLKTPGEESDFTVDGLISFSPELT